MHIHWQVINAEANRYVTDDLTYCSTPLSTDWPDSTIKSRFAGAWQDSAHNVLLVSNGDPRVDQGCAFQTTGDDVRTVMFCRGWELLRVEQHHMNGERSPPCDG